MNVPHHFPSAICRMLSSVSILCCVANLMAQGRYGLQAGDIPKAGETITEVDNITMTFGAEGDVDFLEATANTDIQGYTAFTHGNGINPSPNKGSVPTTGTFYVFEPAKKGELEIAVFHHTNNKPLYILEDGIVMDAFNGIVVETDYRGVYTFSVKAGSRYIAYCSGSKMGFYGFNYTVAEDTPDDPPINPDDPHTGIEDPVVDPSAAGNIYDTTTLSAFDANRPLGFGQQVKGNGGLNPVTVTTSDQLRTALTGDTPTTVYVEGVITLDRMITVGSNKSIYGLPGATLENPNQDRNAGILNITGKEVIVRNLTFIGPGAYDIDGNDNITLNGATNVWIDHCDVQDGMDGNLDIVNASDNICISWTRFRYLKDPRAGGSGGSNDHRNCNLIGNSDTKTADSGKLKCTFVSCWWDEGCKERCPRVRYGKVHVANSLYTSNDFNYCIGYGAFSNIYVEACNFYSQKAQKNYVKGYNNNYSYNLTVTGCLGGADTKKRLGNQNFFTPSEHYMMDIYDVNEVFQAVSDAETGAGATLDLAKEESAATHIHTYHIDTDKNAPFSVSRGSTATNLFNLQGQRITQTCQGIIIKNGRKYIESAKQ